MSTDAPGRAATVRVEPSGVAFPAFAKETIIAAAWRNGLSWPTICKGQGTCKTCVFQVLDGAEHLSEISSWEREGLSAVTPTLPGDAASFRLACQACTSGDVTVRKVGVRLVEDTAKR